VRITVKLVMVRHARTKLKMVLDRTSFDSDARKTEFDANGHTISENLVVLKIDVQLQHHGLSQNRPSHLQFGVNRNRKSKFAAILMSNHQRGPNVRQNSGHEFLSFS